MARNDKVSSGLDTINDLALRRAAIGTAPLPPLAKGGLLVEVELDKIEAELKKLKLDATGKDNLVNLLLGKDKPKEAGKAIGDILVGLLVPAIRKVENAYDRTEQVQRNLQIAFALAAYKSDNKRYPAKLDDLAPKYLATVPDDLFTGKALTYRLTEKGYFFYSVGVNGKDEEGRSYDDDPPGDG